MRFLLNMNLPRELGRRLSIAGHACRHTGDAGLAEASDVTIVEEAKANGEIIVTHDLDYGHLLAFSGDESPSLVIVRLRNTHPDNLFARFASALPAIEEPLLKGSIVVLGDAALRIRRLPITQEEL